MIRVRVDILVRVGFEIGLLALVPIQIVDRRNRGSDVRERLGAKTDKGRLLLVEVVDLENGKERTRDAG